MLIINHVNYLLQYRVNINHEQNVQIPVYSACMEINRKYLGNFQN